MKPFNYYQFSEYGITGSGIVSAYRTNFSGFLTPPGMFSARQGFFFPLGNEDEALQSTYTSQFSGGMSSGLNEIASISSKFSGSFYPVNTGENNLFAKFSGKATGDAIDKSTYQLSFTGSQVSGFMDTPTYDFRFTGQVASSLGEAPTQYLSFSGSVSTGNFDAPSFSLALRGNIVKYERDVVSCSANITKVTWGDAHLLIRESGSSAFTISADLTMFCWSKGGC